MVGFAIVRAVRVVDVELETNGARRSAGLYVRAAMYDCKYCQPNQFNTSFQRIEVSEGETFSKPHTVTSTKKDIRLEGKVLTGRNTK